MIIITKNFKVIGFEINRPIYVSDGLIVNEVQSIPKYNKQTEELYYNDNVFTIRKKESKK